MSNPAGNSMWAWSWMGIDPPGLCYNIQENIFPRYEKFKECFSAYYGIGDFDYWKRSSLNRLSEKDKLELINLLLEDNTDKIKSNGRKYIGLNDDGTINGEIDPYADSRKNFYGVLTIDGCRDKKYPHNQRCRYDTGFHCDDCNTFFPKDSEEYLRTEQFTTYGMHIHNIGVYFYRTKTDKPQELIELSGQYDRLKNMSCYKITLDEIHGIRDGIDSIKEKYKETIQQGNN